ISGTGENKAGVSKNYRTNNLYKIKIGNAANEIFALFMSRIYEDFPFSILAQFSKLKFIQGSNFIKFREFFRAKFLGGFIVPAYSFDNVRGYFPIGFTIWNLNIKEKISKILCDVFDENEIPLTKKGFYGNLDKSINQWLVKFYNNMDKNIIGTLSTRGNDFQNQKYIYIATKIENYVHDTKVLLSQLNIIPISIYFTVRHCIEPTWLNDRDQFLYPNEGWQNDKEFQNDCLTFTLFHSQNRITSKEGTNHWIPFTGYEVGSKEKFDSDFMTKFITGKNKQSIVSEPLYFYSDTYGGTETPSAPLEFSPAAKEVFDAGRELWKYYHTQPDCNVNASLYDIREHFQGRNDKGKMNNKSQDEHYMILIGDLRKKLKILAKKIEPKIYEYEFLKE
ncbi:MAG: hypothetical protein QG635_1961, partial [Bacteroidota bacterium]|nr:hypothetical protein [Bacteroidota bacterium]